MPRPDPADPTGPSRKTSDVETARLLLRPWRPEDAHALHAIHADPQVSAWLGRTLSPAQAAASVETMIEHRRLHGWGVLAVCLKEGTLIGAAGVKHVPPGMPVSGVEAQWRLGSRWWGNGYATEAMQPLIAQAFGTFQIPELVAFTAASNARSRAVMERLGFVRDSHSDFGHPALAPEHPLRPHVVYRLRRA